MAISDGSSEFFCCEGLEVLVLYNGFVKHSVFKDIKKY